MKSYPIPSMTYPSSGYCSFNYYGLANIEPSGSIPITLILLSYSFNFLAIPVIVPPVPAPANK